MKIYIKGIWHTEKAGIIKAADKVKPDAILYECREDKPFTRENFKIELYFLLGLSIYFFILLFGQRDFKAINYLHEKRKIPRYYIDLSWADIIAKGHRWYNIIIFSVILFGFFALMRMLTSSWIYLIMAVIVSFMLYSTYFILRSVDYDRNKAMTENSIRIVKKNRYKRPLLVCGRMHKKAIIKNFKARGVKTEEIRTGPIYTFIIDLLRTIFR